MELYRFSLFVTFVYVVLTVDQFAGRDIMACLNNRSRRATFVEEVAHFL